VTDSSLVLGYNLKLNIMSYKQVDKYQYFIADGLQQKAYIGCWKGSTFQGYIDFYEPEDLPSSGINSNGSYHLSYPIKRLESIVSMLREESPVYIYVYTFGGEYRCRISTSTEPVGEEEVS
jgi:hypothetical protein